MLRKISLVLVFTLIGLICLPPGNDAAPLKLDLKPAEILIGTLYNGTTVSVTGEIPTTSDAVILLTGERGAVSLKKKGKALGLLWMNMGKVVLHNIPDVYLIYSSKSISDLSRSPEGTQMDLGLGFQSLEKQVTITSDAGEPEDNSELFAEFQKLKRSEDLYVSFENGVQFQPGDETFKQFSADIAIPPRLKKGQYEMTLFVIQDGAVIEKASRVLVVKEVGFPAFISFMAWEHSAIYGILAAAIAICAGLLMGFIFSKKVKK
ncbi:TIGR02186 family protein [bacterium]|nr:TIGR02186 family protein [bacterium]